MYYTEGERGVDERRGNWKGAETRGRGWLYIVFFDKTGSRRVTRSSRRANKGKERRPVHNSCDNRCSFARHGASWSASDGQRPYENKRRDFSTLLRRRIDGRPPFWATSREKTVQMAELGRTMMHGGFHFYSDSISFQ